jgi:uncharacterized protein (TIGR00369 family)
MPQLVQRQRTIEWQDPESLAIAGSSRTGLELMQGIAAGEVPPPPIAVTLGFDLVSVETGRCVFELEPQEFHYNPLGVVHGGVAATLLDSAMGCAVHTTLPAGVLYTTVGLTVNYVRPVTLATGAVLAEGRAVHTGRRLAAAEAQLIARDSGKLLAHATTNCLVFDAS